MKKLLFLGFVAMSFLACKKPQDFEYRGIKNFKVANLGFNKTALTMDLVYFNPNGFGVTLKNVDCDIYIEKNYLGKFVLDTTLKIEKRSEFSLPAKIDVDMKNIYKNALNVLFTKEVTVTAKGSTRVGKAGFYFTVPINYESKQKFELF